jgi:four helix bundle protein
MSNSQDKSKQMEDRMLDFSFAIVQLARLAPKTSENRIIADQMIRSSSSVGAN